MKKNTMMRIASTLLIAVLLTTCAIGATFAKYVTADNDNDSARVAKWGVTVDVVAGAVDSDFAETAPAFNTTYAAKEGAEYATTIANTVVTSAATGADGKNLVAPGTSGTLASAKITGTPEVAVNVTRTATVTLSNWNVDSAFYCPIVVTIAGLSDENTVLNGLEYTSASEFQSAITTAINGNSNKAANTNLSESFTITWEWAFEDTAADAKQTNVKDTALGDAATAATIEFSLKITVTQLD